MNLVNDAKSTNSVNTIFIDEEETLVGENTDVFGLQAAYFKEIPNIENKKAFSYWSRRSFTISYFFITKIKGTNISIINRTHEKSIFLKKNLIF